MRNLIYFLFLTICFLPACGDDDQFLSLDEYITQNNLNTQVTSSGLNYIIQNQGTVPNPTLNSQVTINYDGYFLGGGSFDSGNNVTFALSNLIAGWQEGLQLIGSGGTITLIIPSNLAYGARGAGSIPPNTDIGFDIDLISHN